MCLIKSSIQSDLGRNCSTLVTQLSRSLQLGLHSHDLARTKTGLSHSHNRTLGRLCEGMLKSHRRLMMRGHGKALRFLACGPALKRMLATLAPSAGDMRLLCCRSNCSRQQ